MMLKPGYPAFKRPARKMKPKKKVPPYLQISPYCSDDGKLIGLDPRETPLADIIALGHPQTRSAAIRAYCLECSGGSAAEARKCVLTRCPLWPLRMGSNPCRAKSMLSDERKSQLRELAHAARAARGVS
jgi:hypothetical protein